MKDVCVSLDLETTGFDPLSDEIIEIGAVKFRGDEVVATYHTLVRPSKALPYRIQILTGLTDEDLEDAPLSGVALSGLAAFLADHPLVGHNISFDLGFLSEAGLDLLNIPYDTFELAVILLPTVSDYSLSAIADELGVTYSTRHRALPDAEITQGVFVALLERAGALDVSVVAEIEELTAAIGLPIVRLFHQVVREKGTEAGGVPAESPERAPPKEREDRLAPVRPRQHVDVEALAQMLAPNGVMSRAFEGFDHRREQVEMLGAVADAFNKGEHLIVEAGTGTGKSVAYLLPASVFAVKNGVRVVISTNTINLQEQLVGKDIPDLVAALEREALPSPRYALLKGRRNYLCLRRWGLLRRSRPLSADEAKLLVRTLVWAASTDSGDQAELNLRGGEAYVWSRICAQTESCLGAQCPFQRRGVCFLYRARRRAEAAHLVVVNHALLLSDVASAGRGRALPDYTHIIIDEAHHLEDVATEQWGFQVEHRHVENHLNRLCEKVAEERYAGLLFEVARQLSRSGVALEAQEEARTLVEETRGWVETSRERAAAFFNVVWRFVEKHAAEPGHYERRLRLTKGVRTQPAWADVETSWEHLSAALLGVEAGLNRLHGVVGTLPDENSEYEDVVTELWSAVSEGAEVRSQLDSVVFRPADGTVYWASQGDRFQSVTLCAAPLDVGPVLERDFFSEKECVILTSATLSTDGDFGYMRGRLGLPDAKGVLLGSPFDYRRLAMVYVPDDIPEPGQAGYQKAVERVLVDVCRAAEGRTLGLFTSHAALRSSREAVRGPLQGEGILVLGQAVDGSSKNLLQTFRTNPRTVLLATASFWEGIDVVGEALSVLVMARLPFSVPTDPVFAARAEQFEDPFNEYAVPQAILRFKQGFGRLIRSKSDRGVIVVLDRRVKTKRYGAAFLRSLPPCEVRHGPARFLPQEVANWLGER